MLAGDADAYVALASPAADRGAAAEFANAYLRSGVDRVTVTPRFESPLDDVPDGAGYEVMVELFSESGARGRLETWQLDVVREEAGGWRILDQDAIDSIDNLRHLSLTPATQYIADNLVVTGEDLSLTLTEGSAFVAETENGVTSLVLLGDGIMRFAPQPEAERGQVEIFSGREALEAEFEAAFIRLHPDAFRTRVSTGALRERRVDRGDPRRRPGRVRRVRSAVVHPGSVGPKRPGLVASAGARRLSRRGPHRTARHADLYAVAPAAGGHHAVRPGREPDHLAVPVRPETSDPGTLLRGRRRAVARHPGLRGHGIVRAPGVHAAAAHRRPRVHRVPHRRHHPHRGAGEGVSHHLVQSASGRRSHGPVGHVQRVRPTAVLPHERTEQPRGQPALGDSGGHRVHGDGGLRGRPRGPGAGRELDREAAPLLRGRGGVVRPRGAPLRLQQPQLLVSAGAGQRLCHGDARSVGAGRVGYRRERSAGQYESSGVRSSRRGAASILVCGAAAGPLSVGGDLPLRRSRATGSAGPARRPRVDAVRADRRGRVLRHPRGKRLRHAAKRGRDRRHGREGRGHRLVLRVDSRRHPVSIDDRGPHRQPPSGRAQPRVLRHAQPRAAPPAGRQHQLADRSGELQRLSVLLSGPRGRASMVGDRQSAGRTTTSSG